MITTCMNVVLCLGAQVVELTQVRIEYAWSARLTTHIAHPHTLPKHRTGIQHLGEFSLVQVIFCTFR